MLDKFNSHIKKRSTSLTIPKRGNETPSTASLENILPPAIKKYITGTKTNISTTKVIKEQKIISTSSLETITPPIDKNYETGVKSFSMGARVIGDNIINDFHQEILQYSARYVKKHADKWNAEENTITFRNTLLDYGTEGPGPNNFEVIIHGIHSPGIYTVKQVENDVVVTFGERLFSYDGLQKQNVIIIGKLLDIALLTEQLSNTLVITDENGTALIL